MPTRGGKPRTFCRDLVRWRSVEDRPPCPELGEVITIDRVTVERWPHRFYIRRGDELLAMADTWCGVQVLLGWLERPRWCHLPSPFAATYTGTIAPRREREAPPREREARPCEHRPPIGDHAAALRRRAAHGFLIRRTAGAVLAEAPDLEGVKEQRELLRRWGGVTLTEVLWADNRETLTLRQAQILEGA